MVLVKLHTSFFSFTIMFATGNQQIIHFFLIFEQHIVILLVVPTTSSAKLFEVTIIGWYF